MIEREINEQIVLRLGMTSHIRTASFMCHCPYHTDKTPSCGVDLDKGVWHCFSCGQSGKLRALFRDINGHSINKELRIPWEKQSEEVFVNPFQSAVEEDIKKQPDVHIALDGIFIPATDSIDACKYLANRCIPISIAESMRMQFASTAKSFNIENPADEKEWVYFTKRLVIPIYENGKLMSCEGRDIYGQEYFNNQLKRNGKDPSQYHYKKCIYPHGSSTSTLYDLDKLDRNKTLYFLEGIMDLAILRTDSYFTKRNSTAVFGASLSKRQYALLSEFKSTVDILDNDLAGWESLKRWKDYIKENNLGEDHKFILPPYTDMGVKDLGDVPVKIKKTIKECRDAKWLTSAKSILLNEKLIDAKFEEFRRKKLEEGKGK